jgi:hypothetical protein
LDISSAFFRNSSCSRDQPIELALPFSGRLRAERLLTVFNSSWRRARILDGIVTLALVFCSGDEGVFVVRLLLTL